MRALRKLRSLRLTDVRLICEAQLALVHAQLLVATRPSGRLIDRLPGSDAGGGPRDPRAWSYGLAVQRAARFGLFRPQCLVRALALHRLLERHGIRGSRVRVGVRRVGDRFSAHAWVEYGPAILADRMDHVGTFTPLADVRVAQSR